MPKSLYSLRKKERTLKPQRSARIPARFGDGFGNLRGTKTGMVYVTMADGIAEAFCNGIMPVYGAGCWISQDSDRGGTWQVVGAQGSNPAGVLEQSPNGFTEISRALRLYAQGGGQAPLFSEGKQILPGLVFPSTGYSVNVYQSVVRIPSGWFLVASQTVDLSAHVPAGAGDAVLALITVDTSGAVQHTAGTEFVLIDMTTPALMLANMPAIPADTVMVLGAVRLYNAQDAIAEGRKNYTDIVDTRWAGITGTLANIDSVSDAINAAPANTIVAADKIGFWDASTGGLSSITYAALLTLYNAIYARGAGTLTTVTTNDITGTAHTHAVTSSASITAAGATLLATDASGFLRLLNLGVGAAASATAAITTSIADGAAASVTGVSFAAQKGSGSTTGSAQGLAGSARVIAGVAAATASLAYGGSFGVTLTGAGANTATVSLTAAININAPSLTAPISVGSSRLYGIQIANQGNALLTTTRAINIANQSGSSVLNYAIQTGTGIVTFGDQTNVTGSQDVQQLVVTGHTTQTDPAAQFTDSTAATNTVRNVAQIQANSSGTVAASFGAALVWKLQTATAATKLTAARIYAQVVEAAAATFKSKLVLSAWDTAERIGLEISADGSLPNLNILGATVGNEAGDTTTDFRWETDTEPNMHVIDASANKMYFGGTTNGIEISAGGELKLLGTATVWQDVDFPIIIRTTGANIPTLTAVNGNLTMPQWAVNDFNQCESQEFVHQWKEGSECFWHCHYTTNGLDATDRYVQFEIEYGYVTPSGVWTFPATINTGDILIPASTADKTMFILPLASFTPAGVEIGGHVLARFKRVAATGTAPSGNPWIPMLQLHIECDSIGSKTISDK